jgi:hypothetical protein
VPRMHMSTHVLDHFRRNLGLRLALADALQQCLAYCGSQCHSLSGMVLFGQQLDNGLCQRRLWQGLANNKFVG